MGIERVIFCIFVYLLCMFEPFINKLFCQSIQFASVFVAIRQSILMLVNGLCYFQLKTPIETGVPTVQLQKLLFNILYSIYIYI